MLKYFDNQHKQFWSGTKWDKKDVQTYSIFLADEKSNINLGFFSFNSYSLIIFYSHCQMPFPSAARIKQDQTCKRVVSN